MMRKLIAVIAAVVTYSLIYMKSQYKEKDLFFVLSII